MNGNGLMLIAMGAFWIFVGRLPYAPTIKPARWMATADAAFIAGGLLFLAVGIVLSVRA